MTTTFTLERRCARCMGSGAEIRPMAYEVMPGTGKGTSVTTVSPAVNAACPDCRGAGWTKVDDLRIAVRESGESFPFGIKE
jgi:DnaJ-class molecular chaperone